MNGTRVRRALATATALATLAMPVAAFPAAAKPEGAGSPVITRSLPDPGKCALQRLDRQLLRCDNLTGGGVAAPLSVPEL
jgi:hypothetical protein